MHPCCWGNAMQLIMQVVPLLAVFAVGGRKFVTALRQYLPTRKTRAPQISGALCCRHANDAELEHELQVK
jgi:hypothetical protein